MKTKNNIIITLLGILLLGILLFGAFYIPGLLSRFYDSRTLGQINTQKVELDTYELTYADFADKLHAMGLAVKKGASIDLIKLVEDVSEEGTLSDQELTEQVRMEVESLLNAGLLMDVDMSEYTLYNRELYTIYGSAQGGENMLSGIRAYKLSYIWKDAYEDVQKYPEVAGEVPRLTLYVDSEFYKIYAFSLKNAPTESIDRLLGGDVYEYNTLYTEALLDYWGVEQGYELHQVAMGDAESWGYDSGWGGCCEETLIFDEDAQISLWKEIWMPYKWLDSYLMGMQPFTAELY